MMWTSLAERASFCLSQKTVRTTWVCVCPVLPFSWPWWSAHCCQATSGSPSPTSFSSSTCKFYWSFRLPPTSTTPCTHFLARHRSRAQSILVRFSSVLPIKYISSPLPPSWHVMEAQFKCAPLAGGKVHVISSGQKFINDSRLSISLILWDLPAPLFSLWYNDQQCSKWMDLQSTCKISRK